MSLAKSVSVGQCLYGAHISVGNQRLFLYYLTLVARKYEMIIY